MVFPFMGKRMKMDQRHPIWIPLMDTNMPLMPSPTVFGIIM